MTKSRKDLKVGDQATFRATGKGAQFVVDFLNAQENRSQAIMEALYFYVTNGSSRPHWVDDMKMEVLTAVKDLLANGIAVPRVNSEPLIAPTENVLEQTETRKMTLEMEVGGSLMEWVD